MLRAVHWNDAFEVLTEAQQGFEMTSGQQKCREKSPLTVKDCLRVSKGLKDAFGDE